MSGFLPKMGESIPCPVTTMRDLPFQSLQPRGLAYTGIYLGTKSLKPDPRNPRLHSDKQVRQIAQSIESFGFNVPILIDGEQR